MSVTTTQFILMVLAIMAMLWGLYAIFRSWQAKQNPAIPLGLSADATTTETAPSKDGIPIVPRHERQLPKEDALALISEQETDVAASLETDETFAVANNIPAATAEPPLTNTPTSQRLSSENIALNTHAGTTTTITADGDMYVSVTPPNEPLSSATLATPMPSEAVVSAVPDAFSALANATQAITPVVHTYDENQLKSEVFTQNSPILDTHIQAQIDQEQNSPLHNAEQNINISIFPRHQLQRFAGRDFLGFVDKYGLKYGAMNMFHRYENKDGTGILWFSVMMVENQVPSAFDLHKLPLQHLDGLILFLSLPHPEAGQAFESMISLAKMMANDLNAELYDDVGEPLSGDSIALLKSIAVLYGTQPE